MYGHHSTADTSLGIMATQPPRERIDFPLYDIERNQPARFVPQYLKPYNKAADLNMSNLPVFMQQIQLAKTTPTMQSRLVSNYAFIPVNGRKAQMGSS